MNHSLRVTRSALCVALILPILTVAVLLPHRAIPRCAPTLLGQRGNPASRRPRRGAPAGNTRRTRYTDTGPLRAESCHHSEISPYWS